MNHKYDYRMSYRITSENEIDAHLSVVVDFNGVKRKKEIDFNMFEENSAAMITSSLQEVSTEVISVVKEMEEEDQK